MLYKLFPLDTEPRRCVVVGEEPPPVPKHTPASLAAAVRASFPEMTVYEPKGKPFIVVQADLPLRRRPHSTTDARTRRLGQQRETHRRRRQFGEFAIVAICRNENCRSEPVGRYRELTKDEKVALLRRHGFSSMARALENDPTR